MSAQPLRGPSDGYLVVSQPRNARQPRLARLADLPACMAKLAQLVMAGERVLAVRQRGRQLAPSVLEAMLVLVERPTIIRRLALRFGLSAREAERSFGHLFSEAALVVQGLLQVTPWAPGVSLARSQSSRRAAGTVPPDRVSAGDPVAPWPLSDPPPPENYPAETRSRLGVDPSGA